MFHATARTNPLLWWIGVLIQTEVLDSQTRPSLDGVLDILDFPRKLEAVDHYGHALLLSVAYDSDDWPINTVAGRSGHDDRQEVMKLLATQNDGWIEGDLDRPGSADPYMEGAHEEYDEIVRSAWRTCRTHVEPVLGKWLTQRSPGALAYVINLRQGNKPLSLAGKKYIVKMTISEDFSTEPITATCYPSTYAEKSTLQKANNAARRALADELGDRHDAQLWEECFEPDGRLYVRAVYRDLGNDAKATAWVEEETTN